MRAWRRTWPGSGCRARADPGAGDACSAGKSFGAGSSLAQVQAALDGATAGTSSASSAGRSSPGSTGLVLQRSGTATAPIVLCSASGGRCSAAGGANARLRLTGAFGLQIRAGTSHVTVRDLDLQGNPGGDGVVFHHPRAPPRATFASRVAPAVTGSAAGCRTRSPTPAARPPTSLSGAAAHRG